jgi:protein Tex
VSGLNQLTARRVYDYRAEHGPFQNRQQLMSVPGFGDAAFVQAAGFLKIGEGDNPLDATWIHPESYDVAQRVLETLGFTPAGLAEKETASEIGKQAAQQPVETLASSIQAGELLLKDILAQLSRPGRDPREDLPPPIFKKGVMKLDDLAQGMELSGTVLNVVDFGAFVDIGLHDTGLVHISQLANRYVRDPHDVVSVGDIVKVWVHEIDKERRRVSLTMIPPGTERGPVRRGRDKAQPEGAEKPKRRRRKKPRPAAVGVGTGAAVDASATQTGEHLPAGIAAQSTTGEQQHARPQYARPPRGDRPEGGRSDAGRSDGGRGVAGRSDTGRRGGGRRDGGGPKPHHPK